eukprot:55640-Eustigmatos_ZCMA.PRE.1
MVVAIGILQREPRLHRCFMEDYADRERKAVIQVRRTFDGASWRTQNSKRRTGVTTHRATG